MPCERPPGAATPVGGVAVTDTLRSHSASRCEALLLQFRQSGGLAVMIVHFLVSSRAWKSGVRME